MKAQKQLLLIIFSILAITACSGGNQHQTGQGGSKVDDMSEAKPFVQALKDLKPLGGGDEINEFTILRSTELELERSGPKGELWYCRIKSGSTFYVFSYEENEPINSYEGLSQLSNLQVVTISENYDQTLINELSQLPKLKELSLDVYTDVDHTLLSKISSLEKLSVGLNNVENPSYWNTLPTSTDIELTLINFPISEQIDVAAQYPNLVCLYVQAASQRDMERLAVLKHLKKLEVKSLTEQKKDEWFSYSWIFGLATLEELQIVNPTSLNFGGPMKNLKQLIVVYNSSHETEHPFISSLEPLDTPELEFLAVYCLKPEIISADIQMLSLKGIEKNRKLNYLSITDINLVDISALKDLDQLVTIFLSNNHIKDISALGNLPNLKDLDCSYNQITDISSLKNNASIERLKMGRNPLNREIVDEVLPTMTHLEEYYIAGDLAKVISDN